MMWLGLVNGKIDSRVNISISNFFFNLVFLYSDTDLENAATDSLGI
jgi:hypothetical protein